MPRTQQMSPSRHHVCQRTRITVFLSVLALQQGTTTLAFTAPGFAKSSLSQAGFAGAPRLSAIQHARLGAPLLRKIQAKRAPREGLQQSTMIIGLTTSVVPVVSVATLPMLALQTLMASARSYPLLLDCIFAGALYVAGKVTSSAILGKRESSESLTKWFICGLVDGWACHAWYSFLEVKFAYMTNKLTQTLVMNGLSSTFFTPTYCAGFLVLLSLLERKGVRGAVDRVKRDYSDITTKSVQVWAALNMPLFLCVPLHMRVVVSMGMHYVYLVGLALWDANVRKAADAGTCADTPAEELGTPNSSPLPVHSAGSKHSTAWGTASEDTAQPVLNLAYAKVSLVNLDIGPHGPHQEPPL